MVFFFSSRRRHTRYWRDWSSDVCSSDLGQVVTKEVSVRQGAEIGLELDPSLNALMPEGVNLSPRHTYPLQRRYAHGSGVLLGRLEEDGYAPPTSQDGFQSADLKSARGSLATRYLSPEGRATLDVGR